MAASMVLCTSAASYSSSERGGEVEGEEEEGEASGAGTWRAPREDPALPAAAAAPRLPPRPPRLGPLPLPRLLPPAWQTKCTNRVAAALLAQVFV
jgi:hypothetical protein